MQAKLVCYALKANASQRTKLHRELYGYEDSSNHGRYSYRRKGLLDKIRNKRVTDAVIIIESHDTKKLINLLKKHGAKTHVFDIILKKDL